MSTPPILQKLATLHEGDMATRRAVRYSMDLGKSAIASCKTCPKPVWFTAFFDGTGNSFNNDGGSLDADALNPEKTKYSNVAKLWAFACADKNVVPRTKSEYIEGVGTPCAKVGDSGRGIDSALGMAAASKGEARIRWMLDQLDRHVTKHMPFVNQINLAVFGFSRGATQARAFVRMLTETLAFQQGDELIWRKAGADLKQPRVLVYFVGLFDTVSSTGFGGSRLERAAPAVVQGLSMLIPGGISMGWQASGTLRAIDKGGHAAWAQDLRIPSYVKQCVHYVASHEVREKFPSDSVREDQTVPGNCTEVFYPGMHSDVGGGYEFSTQEGRSNELSRVALNNMYVEAWRAGVPLKSPAEVMSSAGALFNISEDLETAWNAYMGQGEARGAAASAGPSGTLEAQIIWHMNRYYQWRAGRRRRLKDGRLKPGGEPDVYMQITDKEWEDDIVDVAKARTGWVRTSVFAHQEAMFEAYSGTWLGALPLPSRRAFDRFFDQYVHDSIAGFKRQMTEASIGLVERSRWSMNRQIFMGKRGDKFIYWRYEGWTPEYADVKTAMAHDDPMPVEADVLTPALRDAA